MKILITGGHITPALAVIDEFLKRKDIEIVIVGRQFTGGRKSFEFQETQERKLRFIGLPAGRLTRVVTLESIISLIKIPLGFVAAFSILLSEKPTAILSFGGYIALPICIAAFFCRIPFYTHEQTLAPGLANKLIAPLAKKVFISFPQSVHYFPSKKTIVSGNPIRDAVYSEGQIIPKQKIDKPVILILGGSLGSHSINTIIERNLPELLDRYILIHQTGNNTSSGDFERLAKRATSNYLVYPHLIHKQLGSAYAICDLVISRAGANTLFELIALKKPSILIPLPWAAEGEQNAHAHFMEDAGVSVLFEQRESPEKLLPLIEDVIKNKQVFNDNFEKLSYLVKQDASQIIVNNICHEKL